MTKAIERGKTVERAKRPPLESVREAPFKLVRDAAVDGEPNDGLTLDGYGAVFNSPAIIDSWEGRFREIIAPGSMKRSFRETPPKIQYDHGRHPLIGSIPIASVRSVTEDTDPVLAPEGGAHVVGRIFDNWLMQPVRDAIASDPPAINGMSFRFEVVRESWAYADGSPIKDDKALIAELDRTWLEDVPDDDLPIRTMKELKVPEIGPVMWPAYESTSVSVRNKFIDLGRLDDPEQRKLLARAVFIADGLKGVTSGKTRDADDDPGSLAAALDAVLDQVSDSIADIDLSTLPADVAQAFSLMVAAETVADELLEAMGVFDPDDDEAGESDIAVPTGDQGQDADDDPASLAGALDALLDEAGELLAGVDMSSLPGDSAQVCYLIVAAETTADALLEAMGVFDPDSDEANEPRSKGTIGETRRRNIVGFKKAINILTETGKPSGTKNVDAQQTTEKSAGKRPSRKNDAQQSTSSHESEPVGEHPSQSRSRRGIDVSLRTVRDMLQDIRTREEREHE